MERDAALRSIFAQPKLSNKLRVYKSWFYSEDPETKAKFTPNLGVTILKEHGYVMRRQSEWSKKYKKNYHADNKRVNK